MAKGFHQSLGVDFFETFSPVVKASTIRVVLGIAVSRGWKLRQLDFNNAFLNGALTENVYMNQPPGYVDSKFPHYVCKLDKALYGFKQAPRAWNNTLKTVLLSWGFTVSRSDTSLFVYKSGNDVILMLVYVDGVVVTGNNSCLIDNLISVLDTKFALKDLGELQYFLALQIHYLSSGLILNQEKYVDDLLQKLNLMDLKSPCVVGKRLSISDGTPMANPFIYRSTIGALQYLTNTRPAIAFVVNYLSQFLKCHIDAHWQAVKRVLWYVSGTKHLGLFIQPSESLHISAYSDADWASNIDDRKSVCCLLCVHW